MYWCFNMVYSSTYQLLYGDETLKGLMDHTKDLSQELSLFTEKLNDLTKEPVGSNEEKEK